MKTALINGFENYQINEFGDILNLKTNRLIKKVYSNGYLLVGLFKNGERKFFLRHRLVAESFIPNTENKQFINHINGIRDDNRIENLEWVTHSENVKHAYDIGLNENVRKQCRKMGKVNWQKAVNARKQYYNKTYKNERIDTDNDRVY
jgi:hypothetical protein